jgi:hypothetical protein
MASELKKNLLEQYVLPFREQREASRHLRKTQKDLAEAGNGISEAKLSRVFRNIGTDNEIKVPAPYYGDVYRHMQANWRVLDGVFAQISSPRQSNAIFEVKPHPAYPKEAIDEARKAPNAKVRILDTYALLEQQRIEGISIQDWLSDDGRTLQILVLNPAGRGFKMREKSGVWEKAPTFRARVLDGLRNLLTAIEGSDGRLEVRLMDELPAAHAVIFDERLFYGLHFSFSLSQDASFFEVNGKENHVFRDFDAHFDTIWKDTKRSRALDSGLLTDLERKTRQANYALEYLVGSWEVFFHDPRNRDEEEGQADLSTVGHITRGILEVAELSSSNEEAAFLTLPGIARMNSALRMDHLEDCDFAQFRFTDHHTFAVHLSLRCNYSKGKPLYGHFTMMSPEGLFAGPLMLYKNEGEVSAHIYTEHALSLRNISPEVLHRLAFREEASFRLDNFSKDNESLDLMQFAGVYHIYAHGRAEGDGLNGILINVLEIHRFGYVRFRSRGDYVAYGRAVVRNNNLYITLTHGKKPYRVGFFILHTKDMPVAENRLYTGIFLGISLRVELPIGKRVVFQYEPNGSFESLQPRFHKRTEAEGYSKIPLEIRQILSGRIKNFIGFVRRRGDVFNLADLKKEWALSIHPDEIFYEAACFKAFSNAGKDEVIKMLRRAVQHGFAEFERFEREIEKTAVAPTIFKDEDYKRLKSSVLPPSEGAASVEFSI